MLTFAFDEARKEHPLEILDGMDTATCSSGNPGETVLFHDGRNGRKEWLQ